MSTKICVKKTILTEKNVSALVDGITLLSIEEFKNAQKNIKRIDTSWWLRSPGVNYFTAAIVEGDGYVYRNGYRVDYKYGVRPALKVNLESSDLQIGDSFQFGEYTWTVISDNYALCDTTICNMPFRKSLEALDANNYESSDIKKSLDEWYVTQINDGDTLNDLISRAEVLGYIDRVKNSGLGKHKSLEYIDKYVKCMNPAKEIDTDLISRQATIEAIEEAYCKPCKERGDDHNEVRCRACNFDDAIIQIDAVPPVESKTTVTMTIDGKPTKIDLSSYEVGYYHGQSERPKGEWIVYSLVDEGRVELECPECGDTFVRAVDYRPHFCENCGADMRGDRE